MNEQVPVQAIRKALAKATPAPWGQVEPGDRIIWAEEGDFWPVDMGDDDGGCANPADAELIVLLRNNAEALLDLAHEWKALWLHKDELWKERVLQCEALLSELEELRSRPVNMDHLKGPSSGTTPITASSTTRRTDR